jgi:hypothetical protein
MALLFIIKLEVYYESIKREPKIRGINVSWLKTEFFYILVIGSTVSWRKGFPQRKTRIEDASLGQSSHVPFTPTGFTAGYSRKDESMTSE